jgi:lipoprotein-anchoring transpeptidase ErfK/SrfK
MTSNSRREFLRSAGLLGLAAVVPPLPHEDPIPVDPFPVLGPVTHWKGAPLGRVLLNIMTIYQYPSWRSKAVGEVYQYDDVVPVLRAVGGEGLYYNNHTWLQTDLGYIYSSWVQPVEDRSLNVLVENVGEGVWGEVTVPRTRAYIEPTLESRPRHWLYYNTTNRIIAQQDGFYLLEEIYGFRYWVQATHVRIIPPEEIAPLSPDVPPEEKRIKISIGTQTISAFEGEKLVLETHISTGTPSTPTPTGQFRVFDKRQGQRMTGGAGPAGYNLPGIPWISYFTLGWIALHGCYWHNDYGRRHSSGCINLLPETAQWFFRWTTPVAEYHTFKTEAREGQTEPGTQVSVTW